MHVDGKVGFAACYPEDWLVAKQEDRAAELVRVTFSPPSGAEGAGLRYVSVSTSPAFADGTAEDFVQEINNWLRQEYYRRLLSPPGFLTIDGHKAVDAAYESQVVLGRQVADITRWVTAFRAHDQRWFIDVAGRSESRDELERIRAQFLAHFRVLPTMAQH
jgi:hypothetical protein